LAVAFEGGAFCLLFELASATTGGLAFDKADETTVVLSMEDFIVAALPSELVCV